MASSPVDRNGFSRFGIVLVFVVGAVFGLLSGELARLPRAEAQIPDPAIQRNQSVKLAEETNRLLRDMLSTLRTGTLKVQVVETVKATRTTPPPPAPPARPR
ncbi:MAG: hypothetical protein JXQ73_33520 [Phycisphaerae bacterium]|nr:hypothetical protein [Phycisphaerae bacterium]